MQAITSVAGLKVAIQQLERKQAEEAALLKEQFQSTYESLKPVNLVKSAFKEAVTSPDLKNNLVGTAIGITAGYLSKSLIVGVSKNPATRIIGSLLQFGITNIVSKNTGTIKLLIYKMGHLFNRKKKYKIKTLDDHPA